MDENQRILAKGASAQRLTKPILFILSCEKRPKSGRLRGQVGRQARRCVLCVHVNGVNLCYQEFRVQGAQAYVGYLCQRSYSKTWEGTRMCKRAECTEYQLINMMHSSCDCNKQAMFYSAFWKKRFLDCVDVLILLGVEIFTSVTSVLPLLLEPAQQD